MREFINSPFRDVYYRGRGGAVPLPALPRHGGPQGGSGTGVVGTLGRMEDAREVGDQSSGDPEEDGGPWESLGTRAARTLGRLWCSRGVGYWSSRYPGKARDTGEVAGRGGG